jgi:hypothetical protein
MRILGELSIAVVALCGICAESARADEVVYDFSGTLSTNGGGDVNIPQFNPALGQIDFGFVGMLTLGTVTGTVTFEIPPSTFPFVNQIYLGIDGTDGAGGPVNATVFAEGNDFSTVTVTVPWSLDLPTGEFLDVPVNSPLWDGTGTFSSPFPINIYCLISCPGGQGSYVTNFTIAPSIAFTAEVVYPYIPATVVPEPRLILPTALLLLGMITGRFRRLATKMRRQVF